MTALIFATAASFAVTLAIVRVIEGYAPVLRLVDRPNDRSSHVLPRPRGGGIGIIGGVGAGLLVTLAGRETLDTDALVVLGAAFGVGMVGLWDDIAPLPAWPRLVAQLAAASVVVGICGAIHHLPLPPPLDVPLDFAGPVVSVIWLVGVTNFFNFMDGADGLASGQAAITFVAFAFVTWGAPVAILAVLALAATAAFLLRNWAPAKIFLGDVGSGGLGFLIAALPFAASVEARTPLTLFAATSLILFLVDPVLTLGRRLLRGAPLTASHREHAYQRLFDPGQSHAPVVSAVLAGAAVVSGAAVVGYLWSPFRWPALGIALVIAAVEWWAAEVRSRRRARNAHRYT